MTIRAKVLGALGVLMLLAAVEAALVVYVQRDAQALAAEVNRLSAVLHDHGSTWRALIGMKTDDRGWRLSASPLLERRFSEWAAVYDATWPALDARVLDAEQRGRLVELEAAVEAWRRGRPGTPLPPGASPQALTAVVEASDVDFAPIESLMIAFEEREMALLAEVQALAADHRRNATLAMLLLPALAGVLMIYMFVRARRTLLDPLVALTSSASRIAGGDYRDISPTARPDEIGMLQNAFAHMGRAIADRERDLTAALEGSRTMTARYAEASAEAQIAHTDLLATLQTVPAALLILDADGRVRLQNRAAADLLGVEPGGDDARRQYWARFRFTRPDGSECPPDELATLRALRGEEVFAQELDVHHPDGRVVPIVIGAAPLVARSGDRLGAVAAFQDITPLREVDRLKDEFVSVVSHELRTPLTSIRGSLQLVMGDEGAVPGEDHRGLLTVALNNCERLIRIINDILDVSKIEAGHLDVRPRPAALACIVANAVENVAALAAAGGVALDVRVPDDLPSVFVDPARMEQVVVNLLSNAIKFSPPGSTIAVEAAVAHDVVTLGVADQGPGIAPENLERIFRKFQQIDSSASRRRGGTGLGLAIAKALVERQGGTIAVESTVGAGTRFSVTLPRSAEAAVTPSPLVSADAGGDGPPRTVLIVDDDGDLRRVLRAQLEGAGYRVLEARDGSAAFHVAREANPDVITVDLSMPGVSGWELVERLEEDPEASRIPVIVLSGMGPDADTEATARLPRVMKPVSPDSLLAEVARAVRPRAAATVVVAEDDDDLRGVLAQALTRAGYRVLEARDGAEALALVDQHPVDLMVLDLRMPNVDGYGVIRRLRGSRAGARLPVLVVSGHDRATGELRALRLGANVYLAKPVDAHALLREVQRLL